MKKNDISSSTFRNIPENVISMLEHMEKKKQSFNQSHNHMLYNENNKKIPQDTAEAIQQTSAGKDVQHMDWQEKYFEQLEKSITEIKDSFKHTEQHISQVINQALKEMRDRDNQRHNEMAEIRQMLSEERRWIIGIAITVILGVAAMVVTVLLN